ncbi:MULTISPECIES: ABC transporter family substrate-binding protein [Saccharopolyspora]|uniref:ABC transporter family substrate-binding protein n=1 Tax=Saccharopolyspora TaxID=1835 RepID=UPI001CD1F0D4|nr:MULTISPECIES: ABC transporter family substrate-binding protein [Saccharopolyspora]MCA1185440.1 ABC transporter family substrate-binding protein [Saccharopolyspora sp. 6T]MCA1192337.1 ABC transporter family substrate-binding protein [Saccharopolyspora sp. 6V]MCA1225219.1 ABC transporter family substrate-binding protein [Saccharopolyspora sp. 6M]MCA1279542.1 ABC transporter family substrate-binding protein [Saccharopolyspora sp. 7B]
MHQGRRPLTVVSLLVTIGSLVVACTDAPPPPLVAPPEPSPQTAPSTQPMPTEVVVGVDSLEGGFNPHTLADLSPTSSALSSLMLPSVFRPGPDGANALDTTLMESAEVVPEAERFTVRYRIRKEAAWSDGAPIAAEDFVYLWEQLRSQPGVSDPAGYQLIDDVQSRNGGKAVEVTFERPYPGWQSLFANLLPAHLLRDAPRGWTTALDNGYPASGGPFAIRQVDLQRGEIILERNDRFWGKPAVSDRIVLRASDQAGQVAALRSGDLHMAVFGADRNTMGALRDLGSSVQVSTVPRPATMQVLLRPTSAQLADARVRNAVVAGLDREALIDVGSGGGPGDQLHAHAQVLAPSERGYTPTEPPGTDGPDPARVQRLLTEAGYEHRAGAWTKDGRTLNLVIAAPFEHEQYIRIAEDAAAQLRAQDIQATVVTPTGDQLFGEMLPANPLSEEPGAASSVDMAIAPRPADGDPAAMMATSYGCPGVDSDDQPFPFTATGFCDQLLQPTIDAALSGALPFPEASAKVESVLWSQAVALPLYQQAQVLAFGRDVTGVQRGNGLSGPFSTAADWKGTPSDNDGY